MVYTYLGWPLFWICVVLSLVLLSKYKKVYPIFYMISVFLYIFSVSFMIDTFNIGEFGILFTLFISAIVFMVLGYYLSKVLVNLKPVEK
jgi:hypothetical protein